MFAIKYCVALGSNQYDFKIFETVAQAHQWWLDHIGPGGLKFYEMLFVIPPGLKNPLQWCRDNIKEVASA